MMNWRKNRPQRAQRIHRAISHFLLLISNCFKLLPFALSLLPLLSCEWFDLPEESFYEEKIVINGLLIANTQLSPEYDPNDDSLFVSGVRINRSADITEAYDENSTALTNSFVRITDLTADSTYFLVENDTLSGVFYHPNFVVEEGHSYQIFVRDTLTNGKIDSAWAETTVPSGIVLENVIANGDTLADLNLETIQYKPGIGENVSFLTPVVYSFKVAPKNPENSPKLVRMLNMARDERLDEYLDNPTEEMAQIICDSLMILEDDTLKSFLFKWHHTSKDSVYNRVSYFRTTAFNMTNFTRSFKMSWISLYFYGWQNLSLIAMDEAYYNYHKGNLDGPPSDPNYMHESNVINGFGLFASGNMGEPMFQFYFLSRP